MSGTAGEGKAPAAQKVAAPADAPTLPDKPKLAVASSSAAELPPTRKDAPSVVLPPGCNLVQVKDSVSLAICAPPTESWASKFVNPSLLFSLAAITLAIWNFVYTRRKDSRARQQSIEDDFWLRKVVSPASIEPLIKDLRELRQKLPPTADCDTKELVLKFWSEETKLQAARIDSLRVFELLNDSLGEELVAELSELDDPMATYVGNLAKHYEEGTPAPSRSDAVEIINQVSLKVFQRIKAYQASVGLR